MEADVPFKSRYHLVVRQLTLWSVTSNDSSFTMLTKSLIALAGFIVLSVAYELLVPDSELKSVLGDPSKSENVFKCILGSGNDLCDAVGKAFKGE